MRLYIDFRTSPSVWGSPNRCGGIPGWHLFFLLCLTPLLFRFVYVKYVRLNTLWVEQNENRTIQ